MPHSLSARDLTILQCREPLYLENDTKTLMHYRRIFPPCWTFSNGRLGRNQKPTKIANTFDYRGIRITSSYGISLLVTYELDTLHRILLGISDWEFVQVIGILMDFMWMLWQWIPDSIEHKVYLGNGYNRLLRQLSAWNISRRSMERKQVSG